MVSEQDIGRCVSEDVKPRREKDARPRNGVECQRRHSTPNGTVNIRKEGKKKKNIYIYIYGVLNSMSY